ncbi:MAG: hypothetical protein WAW92_00830 [Minisyncoccia bacterium]
MQELKKVLEKDIDGKVRRELIWVQRKALYHAALLFKDLAPDAGALGLGWDDLSKKVLSDYADRIKEANFHLQLFDRIFLRSVIAFFSIV